MEKLTREDLFYCYAHMSASVPVHPELGDAFNRMSNSERREVLGEYADAFEPRRPMPRKIAFGIPARPITLSTLYQE